ncbi:MAG: hypothetical protein JKY65_32965 [Planctomycetes bacterium]|nr:hypothetical protein [Planctomycetota bacterium]
MNRLLIFALFSSLLLVSLPCEAKETSYSEVAKSGSDQDKAAAARTVVGKAVERVLKEEGLLKKIAGRAREGLIADCGSLLTKQKFKKSRSGWKFTAKIDLDRVRAKAVALSKGGGKRKPKAGAENLKVFLALRLKTKTGDPTQFEDSVRAVMGEVFRESGLEIVPADPKTQKAPEGALVVSLTLSTKFDPYPEGSPEAGSFQGRYRMMGSRFSVYDPATGSVRTTGRIPSNKKLTALSDSTETSLAEPRVGKKESLAEAEDDYFEHAAEWAARAIVKKLNASPSGAKRSDWYQLRLKGFSAAEVKKILKHVKASKKVKSFKSVGQMKIWHVSKLQIKGDAEKVMKAALKKAKQKGAIGAQGNFLSVVKGD